MKDIEINFARCFGTAAGTQVLNHLRKITVERALGANATDAELRFLEGQRALVHTIINLAKRGGE